MERIRFEIIFKWAKRILPVVGGAIAVYADYHYAGCNLRDAITGNPFISTAYGAFAGFLFVDWKSIFNKNKKEEKKENE